MLNGKLPLNLQISFMLLLLLLLPLLAVGIFLYSGITSDLQSVEQERLENYSLSSSELIEQMGANTLDVATSNSYWEEFRAAVASNDRQWIEDNILSIPDVTASVHFAAIADLNGRIVMQTKDAEGFTSELDPQLVEQFKETPDFHALVPSGDRIAIVAVSRITDEEGTAEPTGMLVFGRFVDETVLANIHDVLYADVAVMTPAGFYMGAGESVSQEKLQPHLEKLGGGYKSFRVTSEGGNERAEMVVPLKGIGDRTLAALFVSLPLKATSHIKSGLIITYTVVGALLLLTTLVFTVWLRYRIVKPLQHISNVLGETASGVLTARINTRYERRGDEIGVLARSFERMRESFRNVTAGIRSLAATLSVSSDELARAAEQSERAGERMKNAAQGMASGAAAQLQSTEESAKSMHEMSVGIARIAESAGTVTDMSARTTQLSREGSGSVRSTTEGMAAIFGSVESSAQTIRRLHGLTQHIGEIVQMVSSIAQQTNLLALNAAIEAARAGEAGRGFAVVAGEVRKLAEQSESSILQITELLDSIRAEADRSVEAMELVSSDVERGTEAMSGLTAMFSEIQSAMEAVSAQIEEVSAVAQQLSAGSEEVSASVDEMAGISASAAARAKDVLSYAEEQGSVASRISDSMKELNVTAQELQKLVEHMKV